jgi:hypothetical protein
MRREWTSKIAYLFGVAWLAAGCSAGTVAYQASALQQQGQIQYTPPPPVFGGTGTSTGTSGSTSGSSSSSGSSGSTGSVGGTGVPPITSRVGTVGYNSVTLTVGTRSILKVQFAPGIQDQTVAGSGYAPSYGHLGVYIQVGTVTQPTPMLSNGLLDGNPQKSPVMDFSKGFIPTCDPKDTTCHQNVTITVFRPNNDYYCMNFGMYCPWAQVYSTHPWHGELSIQTDDTDPLQ